MKPRAVDAEDDPDPPEEERPAKGSLSGLLRDLAGVPQRPAKAVWDHGLRPSQLVDGRYVLQEEIGHGGFGVVFKARDTKLPRFVALKAVPSDGETDSNVLHEVEVGAQLEHENLVRLYDYGPLDSGLYLILELVSGETLEERLRRGPLPALEAVRIAVDVTRALVHAHEHGVLHRDLKPGNVLLTGDGRTKVADFGLAHVFRTEPEPASGAEVTRLPLRAGTPGFMAPEQARGGEQDPRTDIYGVGRLLEAMLHGRRRAWDNPRWELARETRIRKDLDALVARCTDLDPARRPADAGRLLEELTGLQSRFVTTRRRKLTGVVFMALALMLGATAGTVYKKTPDGPVLVAVADLDNQTGDPQLEGLSNLLITSLDQWPDLRILRRDRIKSLARDVASERSRVDCTVALVAAQRALEAVDLAGPVPAAGAMVFCGQAERVGEGYTVRLEALEHGRSRFLLSESSTDRQGLPGVVDRLSEKISLKLGPLFPRGTRRPSKPIAGQTTPSIEAYDHYFKGKECAETPAHGVDCSKELRTALELDPNFAQAAYELAIWLTWNGGSLAEQRSLIERAERLADKAPAQEKTMIHAWAAHLEGDDATALRLLRQATSESPQDKRAFYQLGDIHRHRDELADSIPWFEEAIRLDPEYSWALGDLARVLGALNRTADLRNWAARWREAAGAGTLHGLSVARGWLGDVDGAAEAAQEAALMGAGASAQEDLLTAKLFAGDYRMVEAGARMLTARPSSMRRLAYYGLAALEGYQGRPRAGLARLDELAREIPEVTEDSLYLTVRADFLVWLGNAGPVWREVEQARRVDPRLAAEHAISLAYLGDLEHAELLAKDLPAGTALARTYQALVSLRRGDRARGLSELRAVSAEAPVVAWRMSPLFIYGEELAKAGRDSEAVEVLRRAQRLYVPAAMWRSWAYPRSLYLLANAYHRLGRDDDARPVIGRLLANWAHAETDAPQVRDARRLAAHLTPE